MKTIITALALLILTVSSALAGANRGTYPGIARSTVYFLDVFGRVTDVKAYTSTVRVTIGAPLVSKASTRETNPFSLSISSGSVTTAGSMSLISAALFSVQRPSDFIQQYWTLSNSTTGFTGRLTNSGGAQAQQANFMRLPTEIVPGMPRFGTYLGFATFMDGQYGPQAQTQLTAVNSGNNLTMRLQGFNSNLAFYIITDITAKK